MNPFEVLGIDQTAGDEAVRAAYLAAVRRSPPDRDPEGFRRVREAYDAVRDEERRLALRLFGPAPLERLEAVLDEVPDERRFVGPGPWLDVLRGDRA
ncbi:MAG TPA: DnaJ domain-containing protein [Candidatus Binatia bacterium]|nr:DnaJ domain-containing protein [Candidatus Binatia bacterium]